MSIGKYYFQIGIKNPISRIRLQRIKKIYNKKNHGIRVGVIRNATNIWGVSGDWDSLHMMCKSISRHLPNNELYFWTCSGNFYFVGYDVYVNGVGPEQNIYSDLDDGVEGPLDSVIRPIFPLGSIGLKYDLTPWLEDIDPEIIERDDDLFVEDLEKEEGLSEWSSESDD
jgi:hypothetical protein